MLISKLKHAVGATIALCLCAQGSPSYAQLDFMKKLQDSIDKTLQTENEKSRSDGVTLDQKTEPSEQAKKDKPEKITGKPKKD